MPQISGQSGRAGLAPDAAGWHCIPGSLLNSMQLSGAGGDGTLQSPLRTLGT